MKPRALRNRVLLCFSAPLTLKLGVFHYARGRKNSLGKKDLLTQEDLPQTTLATGDHLFFATLNTHSRSFVPGKCVWERMQVVNRGAKPPLEARNKCSLLFRLTLARGLEQGVHHNFLPGESARKPSSGFCIHNLLFG